MRILFFRMASALLCTLVLSAPVFGQEKKKPSFKHYFVISAYDKEGKPYSFFDKRFRSNMTCDEKIDDLISLEPAFDTFGDFIKFTCVHTDEDFVPLSQQPNAETFVCFHKGILFVCDTSTGRDPIDVWNNLKANVQVTLPPPASSPAKPKLKAPTGLRFSDPSKN